MINCIELYEMLYDMYGPQGWWPVKGYSSDMAYEIMIGAILTQNTAWKNVKRALEIIGDKLSPEWIAQVDEACLSHMIRPSGYYNQKAKRLKALTEWYARYGYDPEAVCGIPELKLRDELLSINGIGPETCYSIMLYAFDKPFFVIDAYTIRLKTRLSLFTDINRYEVLRSAFEENIKKDIELYKEYHALIVRHCATLCRKKPLCDTCILQEVCEYKCLQQN